MNEREKLKAKIEQNFTDQSKLLDEQDKLQLKLKELQEPKLRYGDYGLSLNGLPFIIHHNEIKWLDGSFRDISGLPNYTVKPKNVLGNLTDDLKRNSEDLKNFTVFNDEENESYPFMAETRGSDSFALTCHNWCFSRDQIIKIGQKFIQMAYTTKREQS